MCALYFVKEPDLQVTVAMVSMNSIIGFIPTMAGFSSIVLVVPISTIFGTIAERVRKRLISRTDARVDLMSEVLSSTSLLHCLSLRMLDAAVCDTDWLFVGCKSQALETLQACSSDPGFLCTLCISIVPKCRSWERKTSNALVVHAEKNDLVRDPFSHEMNIA